MRRLVKEKRGAVLAEFAIAFLPVATMFLFIAQFARFEMCRLAVLHTANVSVRACAVVNSGGDEINPGGDAINGPESDANKAAQMVLKPFVGQELSVEPVKCVHNDTSDPYGLDVVDVKATYTCQVPVGKRLMCPSGSRTWTTRATMAHQGAKYKL
jgi:hypothetical protein